MKPQTRPVYILALILFCPTFGWTLLLTKVLPSWHWWDWIDEHVLLGALPLTGDVERLKREGIGAVINTCREYNGPVEAYAAAGIEQLHLPTVDFTQPSIEHVRAGVEFIHRNIAAGRKVYVHCKAGRARSATIVMCYLISKGLTPAEAQARLLEMRPQVSKFLSRRKVVATFAEMSSEFRASNVA